MVWAVISRSVQVRKFPEKNQNKIAAMIHKIPKTTKKKIASSGGRLGEATTFGEINSVGLVSLKATACLTTIAGSAEIPNRQTLNRTPTSVHTRWREFGCGRGFGTLLNPRMSLCPDTWKGPDECDSLDSEPSGESRESSQSRQVLRVELKPVETHIPKYLNFTAANARFRPP
ncbi:hypothetical protein B0H19DRAFT_1062301 [Mycena capillaripes]|nr:hypothetical protein B0H19DRAFT_1062301 [Mycena capillaripes]